jgi:hypothetical protein
MLLSALVRQYTLLVFNDWSQIPSQISPMTHMASPPYLCIISRVIVCCQLQHLTLGPITQLLQKKEDSRPLRCCCLCIYREHTRQASTSMLSVVLVWDGHMQNPNHHHAAAAQSPCSTKQARYSTMRRCPLPHSVGYSAAASSAPTHTTLKATKL